MTYPTTKLDRAVDRAVAQVNLGAGLSAEEAEHWARIGAMTPEERAAYHCANLEDYIVSHEAKPGERRFMLAAIRSFNQQKRRVSLLT